jgi:uncharacterized protein (DUF1697 family)
MEEIDVVVLLRGVNVGSANRVAMADLRSLLEGMRFKRVRTLLNSGNVVCAAPGPPETIGSRIERALSETLGVKAAVVVLNNHELSVIARENTLQRRADNPSRLLVAITSQAADLRGLAPLVAKDWGKEALAKGSRAAYLWCPDGVIRSALVKAVNNALGGSVTFRNWATMTKLLRLVEA